MFNRPHTLIFRMQNVLMFVSYVVYLMYISLPSESYWLQFIVFLKVIL